MSSLVAADLRAVMPGVRADLERLVRIPSIAFDGYPEAPVREAADLTAQVVTQAGLPGGRLLDVPGGPPAGAGGGRPRAGAPRSRPPARPRRPRGPPGCPRTTPCSRGARGRLGL